MSGAISWPASSLLKLACWLMPRERREWADAMRAESSYLPPGAALSWAAGCLLAALKQRLVPMNTGDFRVNRWVMLVEMLGCFGPATLAWWEFTFGPSGAAYFSRRMFATYFHDLPQSAQYMVGLHAGHAITGLIAPIGLFLGLRYVLRNRALDNRALGYALIAAPVLQAIAGVIGIIGFGAMGLPPGVFLLIILLPIAGIAHLMYLAKPAASRPADAPLLAS